MECEAVSGYAVANPTYVLKLNLRSLKEQEGYCKW